MAQYRVNDVIEFVHFDDDEVYGGRITRIITDSDTSDFNDVYEVTYDDEDRNSRTLEIINDDIQQLVARTHTDEATAETNYWYATTAFNTDEQITAERPRRRPSGWTTLNASPTHLGTPRPNPTLPTPEEAVNMTTLRSNDYIPTTESTRLFSFRLDDVDGGIVLTPAYNRATGRVDFFDQHGRVWLNSIAKPPLMNHSRFQDRFGVHWMLAYNYTLAEMTTRSGMGMKTTKKKLRRKYGEMPKIKEEKYYASSKYIA